MTPHKKGSQWELTYRSKGYDKIFTERYSSYDEAEKRCATIEYEKRMGIFIPKEIFDTTEEADLSDPFATFSEILDLYVDSYGAKKWKPSYRSLVRHRINDYIKPELGSIQIKMLSEAVLIRYFDRLYDTKAVPLYGKKESEKNISPELMRKILYIISGACSFAKERGYITTNPAVGIRLPCAASNTSVAVWSSEETLHAISICTDRCLRLCILLAYYLTVRVGELTALRWDHVDISDKAVLNGSAHIIIDRELQRVNVRELEEYRHANPEKVYEIFPKQKENSNTVLAILQPKTKGSVRTIYLPMVVVEALREEKAYQDELKERLGGGYEDHGLVIARDSGWSVEENRVNKLLKTFCKENNLRLIHFHSLRHTSISEKLRQSSGDIKAVQGDAGHTTAKMVTDRYAEIQDEPRRELARKMDQSSKSVLALDQKTPSAKIAEIEQAYELLCHNPALAKILLAIAANTAC